MARHFEDWLAEYVSYNSFNEAPDHFHFWTGVSTIAAALRRRVWLDMGYFQWTPNFYIILVAPPGVATKSTTIGTGQRFLLNMPDIHIGPQSLTWQALLAELSDVAEGVPLEDGTIHTMSAVSFFLSELGTCMNFGDKQLIDTLIDLWDGKPGVWNRRTLMRGREGVVNPWVNIIACTTPAWIADNIPKRIVAGGFSARCIWLFADSKKAYVAYPKLVMQGNSKQSTLLAEDLAEISKLFGEFKMTPEAIALGEHWYEENAKMLGASPNELVNGFRARKQTHVHKLAMVISASRRDDLLITEDDLRRAITIIDSLEPGMLRVFHSLYATEQMQGAEEIVGLVRQNKRMRKAEVYQHFFHRMTAKEFDDLIASAVGAGLMHLESSGATVWLCYGPGC